MKGLIKENQLPIVKEKEFDKPDIRKVDSIIDEVVRDCHNKNFHTFEYSGLYDINIANIANTEITDLTTVDKSMNFYKLNGKLKNDRKKGFIFNQINKLTIKINSNLSNVNKHYYIKIRITILHRQIFRLISHNQDYVKTICRELKILCNLRPEDG